MSLYVEGDVPVMSGNGNNGFGNGWEGLIGLALVAGLFDGGFGFGGGRGQGQCATQADLSAGFANSSILAGINDIKLQMANNLNFVNQGFAGLNTVINQSANTINQGICNLGYELSHQISDCCCATQRAIDSVNYNNAKNACDIIQAINYGNQRIIDYMTAEKIDTLNRKLAVAEGQISQSNQTAILLNAINKTPVPAYQVPNPYCCNQCCGCNGF